MDKTEKNEIFHILKKGKQYFNHYLNEIMKTNLDLQRLRSATR